MADLFTPSRIIVTFCNLLYSIGAYVADWNETHVKNPNWVSIPILNRLY